MLFIYYRITTNSRQALLVNLCIVYTALGFVATQLTLFFNCRPFSGYWTLPPPQEECATYFRFEVIQAVFNISSDLVILSVIIPVLWKLKLAKQDKLPLVFVFSLGFALVSSTPSLSFNDPCALLTRNSLEIGYLCDRIENLYLPRYLGHQLSVLVSPRGILLHIHHKSPIHLGLSSTRTLVYKDGYFRAERWIQGFTPGSLKIPSNI